MSYTNGSRKLALEYAKKHPELKDYTLAKKLYTENNQLFLTVESARDAIRYVRGHKGNRDRYLANKEVQTPLNYDTTNSFVGFDSLAPKLKTFSLPTAIKSVLFLSDIHLPYQDNDALLEALDYGAQNGVDCIWLNGDVMDMYQASAHEKLPSKADLQYEIDFTKDFFRRLRMIFPTQAIYFKEGNHEVRWRRMLMRKAPEIIGIAEFDLSVILNLNEYGVIWIPNTTLVKFGKLNVIHGNEFMGAGGKHPATNLYNKAKADIIAGDKHRTDNSVVTNIDRSVTRVYSVGCLCDLNPEYYLMGHTQWNHGFAHITIKDKNYSIKNFRFIDGEIVQN